MTGQTSDLAQERLDTAVLPATDLRTEVTVDGADKIEADRALLARALDVMIEKCGAARHAGWQCWYIYRKGHVRHCQHRCTHPA
nr:hypothetical protein [uncultured Agathobaculum sp.]